MIKGEISLENKLIPFDLVSGGEFIIDPSTNTRLKILFVPDFDAHEGLRSKTPLPRNPKAVFALLRNNLVLDVQALAEGETKEVGGYPVTFSDYRYYTGLQVKTDKGLPVIFVGFVLLTLGIAIRYMSPKTGHERGEQNPLYLPPWWRCWEYFSFPTPAPYLPKPPPLCLLCRASGYNFMSSPLLLPMVPSAFPAVPE